MSGYRNKAQLIGNLGRDPEVRSLQSGKQVVTLSIATSESWRDAHTGDRIERTEWHRIVIWNEGLGKVAEKYLMKGSKVFVEGKLVTNKWTDKDGVDRYSTEIHLTPYNGELTFLDSKKTEGRAAGDDAPSEPNGEPEHAPAAARKRRSKPKSEPAMAGEEAYAGGCDLDDEIPF